MYSIYAYFIQAPHVFTFQLAPKKKVQISGLKVGNVEAALHPISLFVYYPRDPGSPYVKGCKVFRFHETILRR